MKKPKSKKEFVKVMKLHGFHIISRKGKHEKWSNGEISVAVPNKHREYHVIGHFEILKKAGIV